jgi:uncharacterized 2Fe-2S/4Fe-4S cluster protein (DUF4445 family)
MDIGTNTELLVGNRDRIVAASCPAGPAFEGGGVLCGMPGLDGAIERIALADDGRVSIEVIGGAEPQGICGSGLVDLLSELLRTRRMNAQGRFAEGLDRFIVDAENEIFFTEADVNELAQAKGANVAGLRIAAEVFGVALDDIERFFLAGGFARHIDPAAGRRIGLLPPLPDEKLSRVGNASLEGAGTGLFLHDGLAFFCPPQRWLLGLLLDVLCGRLISATRCAIGRSAVTAQLREGSPPPNARLVVTPVFGCSLRGER